MNCQRMALVGLCLMCTLASVQAQIRNVRPEDHFHRRRVILRMDLNEKINRPLVEGLRAFGEYDPYSGLIGTLLEGLRAGRFNAYDPDDLHAVMSYDDFQMRLAETNPPPSDWEDPEIMGEDPGWISEEFPVDAFPLDGGGMTDGPDYTDLEQVVHVVEDWIFDKNRGEMIYQPAYIQVIWTDPMETLPERVMAVFRYEDVEAALGEATWVNRHNEAEHRNLQEIFELQLWHAYVIEVSGYGIRSLPEAQQRREAMIAFEHELWSF